MLEEYNWAGNLRYSSEGIARPTTVGEVREIVAAAPSVRPLGTRHSFNGIADSPGILVSLEKLDGGPVLDADARTVTVTAGTRYGELACFLVDHGFALHNMASLPHISVGGAVATATHGSGTANLAAAVAELELVSADGSLLRMDRSSPDYRGMVVSLGALGVVTRITLDVEPEYEVRQDVFTDLPWAAVEEHFDAVTAAAYSVSIFGNFTGTAASQVWLKSRMDREQPYAGVPDFFGAAASAIPLNPVPGMSPVNCSRQLGVPGSWSNRLSHFRLGFIPSAGAELQSEYLMDRAFAVDALRALRAMSARIAPLLLGAEIRTVAADDLWLSTSYGRETVAFHFTWKRQQDAVEALLPELETALAPFHARPHWGKLFTLQHRELEQLYPRLADFRQLARRLDPEGKFTNAFLARTILAADGADA